MPPTSGSALVEVVRQTELLEAVRQVLHGEPRVQSEIVTGTLRQHYFAITVAAVRAGDTTGAVVVLHDITELRRLERVRRDFVANVSHEFRTPLTAIQGFAETLLAGAIDDPQNRTRFLEIILEHSRRLARLTEDLLMLSKMDAERLELEIRRLSVSQLIESCLETAQRRAAEKDLRISVNMPQTLAGYRWRPPPSRRGSAKSFGQRHSVHAARRADHAQRGSRRRGSYSNRLRHRYRHPASRSAAHL